MLVRNRKALWIAPTLLAAALAATLAFAKPTGDAATAIVLKPTPDQADAARANLDVARNQAAYSRLLAPEGGMIGSSVCMTRLIRRLAPGSPAVRMAPELPPASAVAWDARLSPPLDVSALWHLKQRASRMGLTCSA